VGARNQTGVVLAAVGSSDPEANAAIARLAARWQARAGWLTVRPAYASAASPDPAATVTGLLRAGARRVVVATYLLAPGYLADQIRDFSLAAGAAVVGPALGASAEVADARSPRRTGPECHEKARTSRLSAPDKERVKRLSRCLKTAEVPVLGACPMRSRGP